MIQCADHKEDMVPVVVIFTVDFFNAIYMATCMHNTSSGTTIIALMALDTLQSATMLYIFHHRTSKILSQFSFDAGTCRGDVLGECGSLCQIPKVFSEQIHPNIGIHPDVHSRLSAVDMTLLGIPRKLLKADHPGLRSSPNVPVPNNRRHQKGIGCFRSCNNKIQSRVVAVAVSAVHHTLKGSLPDQEALLNTVLEILFTTECLVVTAYLEAIIPFFYCCYIMLMVYLPNVRYHADLTGISRDNVYGTILSVVLFGLLQIVPLVILAVIVKRNCRYRALHQLAFVLHCQMPFIQGNLMFWIGLVISFRVVHFGTTLFSVEKLGYVVCSL
ncbi:unnamed protein product [Phytophthora fragariaefolia]|uniref:Unnamed protein product n=1 Tax=Phytophthora fragariaefolia TaxID=1490495 RepID=A0A9W6YG50_9STRA|nr:unnamed protein product [Phytophthora fragariaefolia]